MSPGCAGQEGFKGRKVLFPTGPPRGASGNLLKLNVIFLSMSLHRTHFYVIPDTYSNTRRYQNSGVFNGYIVLRYTGLNP